MILVRLDESAIVVTNKYQTETDINSVLDMLIWSHIFQKLEKNINLQVQTITKKMTLIKRWHFYICLVFHAKKITWQIHV